MAVMKTALLFLTVTLFIILSTVPTKANDALIKRLCGVTDYPQDCETCLNSDPSSKTADEIGLARNSMLCAANDMRLLFQTTFRLPEESTDPQWKGALGVCLDGIEEAQNKINGIWDDIKRREFKGAQGRIKPEISDPVNYCSYLIESKGFQVPEDVAKGIYDVTRDWDIVVSICWVL